MQKSWPVDCHFNWVFNFPGHLTVSNMIPELCPHRLVPPWQEEADVRWAFHMREDSRKEKQKKKKRTKTGEIKARRPNETGGPGMEMFPNSEDLSVVLYDLLCWWDTTLRDREEKCRLLKYRLSLLTSDSTQKTKPDSAATERCSTCTQYTKETGLI